MLFWYEPVEHLLIFIRCSFAQHRIPPFPGWGDGTARKVLAMHALFLASVFEKLQEAE